MFLGVNVIDLPVHDSHDYHYCLIASTSASLDTSCVSTKELNFCGHRLFCIIVQYLAYPSRFRVEFPSSPPQTWIVVHFTRAMPWSCACVWCVWCVVCVVCLLCARGGVSGWPWLLPWLLKWDVMHKWIHWLGAYIRCF